MPFSNKKSIALVGFALLNALLLSGFTLAIANATVESIYSYSYGAVAQARSMCQANDGGYLLAGQTQSSSSNPLQALTMRGSSTGSLLWNKTYGGINDELGRAIVKTNDGGVCSCRLHRIVRARSPPRMDGQNRLKR